MYLHVQTQNGRRHFPRQFLFVCEAENSPQKGLPIVTIEMRKASRYQKKHLSGWRRSFKATVSIDFTATKPEPLRQFYFFLDDKQRNLLTKKPHFHFLIRHISSFSLTLAVLVRYISV